MKKLLLFKKLLIVILLVGLSSAGWAQILYESFDYATPAFVGGNGAAGTSSNNWTTHSVTSGQTTTIDVANGSLTYPGLVSSVGNQLYFFSNANATSRDINRAITTTANVLYFSALVNIIDNSQITATGDYFMHFGATAGTAVTVFGGRLGAKSVNTGANFRFIIQNTSGGTTTFTDNGVDLNFGTTYLIVVKYDKSVAPTLATMWVNPTSLGSTEPTGGVTNNSGTGSFAGFGSICLRENATTPKANIDEIRVGETWADVTPASAVVDVTPPTFTVTPHNNDIDVAVDVPIVVTFDEAIRNIDDSEITDANVASLLTLKETDASGADVPFTATIDADKKIITVTPVANLKNSQVYYAAIAPVEDASNNATTASSMTFTTIAATTPIISDVAITETAPYYAGQNVTITWTSANVTDVKIEAWVPSENQWIELFASTPSVGSIPFTIPADAQYSTDYKIRVTDVNDATATAESSTFTIIAVANDLVTLRKQAAGAIVKYTGVATVTYARAARNQKYIQDATAAVLIDDPTTAPGFITGTYNIGDGITNITGKIVLYNDLIEFTPTAPTGEPATGTAIVPEVRTLESLTPDDQCKLVKIESFAFANPTQNDPDGKFPTTAKNFDVEGISNTLMQFRSAFTEADYMGGYVPVGPISTIALVGQYKTTMQITARSWADMTVPVTADFTADKTFALTGDNVTFTDMSTNHPSSWEWTFEGGTPATSTDQNPVVTYADKGTYAVTLKVTTPSGTTNTVTKTDYISTGVLGVQNNASVVSVYPNPTNGKLQVTNPSRSLQTVEVFNMVGKQVNTLASAKELISFDISNQNKGIYLVKITNNETKAVQFKKVVLK